ncbi:HAD family hydrolase [Glycomyces paridis]|uniref:HAD-IIB family hydrolase n=1 Tax=Glycomyces paridis TaxID=2126555 RepID=A0A4S8PAM2_9ACTN|nr:HAD-IIB family hydrolase [Glycomyces paridis]THV26192.1 HAD-IIB family hydrolase [Glycomyces paridis]
MSVLRVIASDLDGTLLAPCSTLTEPTIAALRAARERGVLTVAVTARPPRVFDEWTGLAALLDAAICSNGAIVYDPAAREVRTALGIDAEAAALAAKTLREALPGLRFAVETGFEVVAEPGYDRVDSVGERRVTRDSLAEAIGAAPQIVKLLAHRRGGDQDALLAAARGLDLRGVALSHSGGSGLLELTAAGVGKAEALAAWCAARGVGPEAVAAFGDAPNDVPMLAWAGRSFAVANAHPEAVAAAAGRCGSNAEDGVAAAVAGLLRSV